jgi:mRNA-degrading endonuclease RelE of RelBE toxin-antitoxin system
VPKRHRVFVAPLLLEQLEELGLKDQAGRAIRDAMSDPEQAGKQLTGSLFPYRRLKLGRYRIIYRIISSEAPPEVRFLYCAMRKEGSKKDVYRQIERVLRRGELER